MADSVLHVTETAMKKIKGVMEAEQLSDSGVRVTVHESGAAFRYQLEFVELSEATEDDTQVDAGEIALLIDAESLPRLRGATLEYVDDVSGSGFRFENPNKPKLLENPLADRVQKLLDDDINPSIASHGGIVSLVGIEDARVIIRMGGGCQGCGMADVTLRQGVEAMLREQIPEITEVVDATDHAAGSNPYYAPSK